jgi:hypothetical protein
MAVHRYAGGSSIDQHCAIRTAITAMLAEAATARLTSEVRMWWSAAYATSSQSYGRAPAQSSRAANHVHAQDTFLQSLGHNHNEILG